MKPPGPGSAVRSLVFLLFQLVVTPLYAVTMVLLFWIPRVPMYNIARHWCWTNLMGARSICGIRWHVTGLSNVPRDTLAHPHIVMSKQAAGRQKDQLFLATHKDALEQLLKKKPAD